MSAAAEVIADLTRLGIRLEAHGDRLRFSPRSAVTPDLAERMKAHKVELLAILRPESGGPEITEALRRPDLWDIWNRQSTLVNLGKIHAEIQRLETREDGSTERKRPTTPAASVIHQEYRRF